MFRTFLRAVFCSLILLVGPATPYISPSQTEKLNSASQEFQTIAPGVEYLRIDRGDKSETPAIGPWVINLLRIDTRKAELRILHALDEGLGLETTTSMAARYGAVAAVNAGFFQTTGTYRGDPSGAFVRGGKLLSEPRPSRAALRLVERNGKTEVSFSHLSFVGMIQVGRNIRLTVQGINRERGANELIVYTPEFHRTTLTKPDGVEIIVRRSRVIARFDGQGSSRIPDDGYVVSASGSQREAALKGMRIGSQVNLSFSLIEQTADSASLPLEGDVVGGGPSLITNGRIFITPEIEGIDPKFVSDCHPRTAIGKLSDGRVLLATVDGRQPGVSIGMSLTELADLLREFGVTDAINLDGGGSTTMVVKGKLVNKPSDPGGERPVSDAILVLARNRRS